MSAQPWPAPAKLNLFLHVTGRRADGYHELQTLFQLIDLVDELSIAASADGRIERSGSDVGAAAEADLCVRAARCLREAAGQPGLGVTLHLHKRIPVGAGLGGGSSDAATTLVALNHLWGLGFSVDRLASLALELGADVPLFVRGASALATGIGDRLSPAEISPATFAVVFPGTAVSTAETFQAPELTRNSSMITIPGFLSPGWTAAPLPGRNDLERVVAARHAPVRDALDWLGRRGYARLTGSGSAVFAAFADAAAAEAALAGLPARWTGFVAQGLARSPLAARLDAERNRAR